MNLQTINASASPEVQMNENFETLEHQAVYGKRHPVTTGLTWGYCGGRWGGFSIVAGTVTLTDDATNYLVVEIATGVASVSTATTNWNDDANYLRVYKITTASGAVTATEDHRAGPGGVHGGAGGGGGAVSDGDKGDVTVASSGAVWTIDSKAITYAKMQDVSATKRVVGRNTTGAGVAEEVTLSQLLDWAGTAAQGDVLYRGASGWALLPAGTSGYFLKTQGAGADPAWDAAGGGSGGTKTYAVFTPMTSQPPASNYATLDTRNSIAVLDFDDTTSESATWVGIMPEAASLGSGLKVRIHWLSTSATSGGVTWGASFELMTTDLDADSFDTETTGSGTANGTSGIETVTEITCTTIDSVAAGGMYRLRIARKPSDGSDTMTGDAEIVAVEVRSAA